MEIEKSSVFDFSGTKKCLLNPFQASVAFHRETSQMNGSYMKRNTGTKWVNPFCGQYSHVFRKSFLVSGVFFCLWLDGIIYKLPQNGIPRNLLNVLEDFSKGKKPCVVQRTSLYMEKYQCWSTSKFHPWSFVVFHRRPHYQCKTFSRWYFFVFCCSWHSNICKWSQ